MGKFIKDINETKTNLKMSWIFIKESKKSLIALIIISVLMSVIGFIVPILTAKQLLKLSNNLLDDLLKVSILIFIIEIIRNILKVFLKKVSQVYMLKTISKIQISMLEEILKIETEELNKNSSGLFIDRIKNDTSDIISIFSDLISYFTDFISNVGIIIAVLVISPIMFIYFMITTITFAFLAKKNRDVYYKQTKELRKKKEKITGLMSEFIRGIKDLKLLNGRAGIIKKTSKEINKVNNEQLKIEKQK